MLVPNSSFPAMAVTAEAMAQLLLQQGEALSAIALNMNKMQEKMGEWLGAGEGGKGGCKGGGAGGRNGYRGGVSIEGKAVENFKQFQGGEEEWNSWADDFQILIDTKCEYIGTALEFTRKLGKPEKEVLGWEEIKYVMSEDDEVTLQLRDLDVEDSRKLSKDQRERFPAVLLESWSSLVLSSKWWLGITNP